MSKTFVQMSGASKFSYGASNQSPKGSFFPSKKTIWIFIQVHEVRQVQHVLIEIGSDIAAAPDEDEYTSQNILTLAWHDYR